MAFHFTDNVHTKSFTPKEYQVELLDAAKERNIIVCLATSSGKVFIATKLIQELSNDVRRPWHVGGKRTVYLVDSPTLVSQQASYLRHLTDLKVGEYASLEHFLWDSENWEEELVKHQVLVMTSEVCLHLLDQNYLSLNNVNLLVLDDCHIALRDHPMRQIMNLHYGGCDRPPKILGLAASLLQGHCDPCRLEREIRRLEKILHSNAETASDIVSVLRYCAKPREFIVECQGYKPGELDRQLENIIVESLEFLKDHRYDPCAVYEEDDLIEELKGIPDPKCDPIRLLNEFLTVLHTLGPFSADKAALSLLLQIEKLKVKTPYERHFLLLCTVATVLYRIRAICELAFQSTSEKENIYKFSSPKVTRLLEILRQYKPERQETDQSNQVALENGNEDNRGKSPTEKNANFHKHSDTSSESSRHSNHNGRSDRSTIDRGSCHRGKYARGKKYYRNGKTYTCSVKIENKTIYRNRTNDKFINGEAKGGDGDECEVEGTRCNSPCNTETSGGTHEFCNGYHSSSQEHNQQSRSYNNGYAEDHTDFRKWRGKSGKFSTRRQFKENTEPGRRIRTDSYNQRNSSGEESDNLCGVIFVGNRFTANVLFHVLTDLRRNDDDFSFINVQYTVDKIADPINDPREAEIEHHKQEEVLKRFRKRECNLLIATSVLEEGIDIPKCNLIVRFDIPTSYRSYVHCKGRAKAQDAHYFLLVEQAVLGTFIDQVAEFHEVEQLLLQQCQNKESNEEEEDEADLYTNCVEPYTPVNSAEGASVNLGTAIALVNRYCAKLPSDTFTRLTPIWQMKSFESNCGKNVYVCTLRLPINSPVKQDIIGPPMETKALARRMVALETCKVLHQAKELDDDLQPIGKESFCLQGENDGVLIVDDQEEVKDTVEPRPGTTKRRQYYYKRIADALTNCRPVPGQSAFLYHISMNLSCPLPEEQNTRGRKIYPPEESPQGFGILTLKPIPKICPFPIFTRSGEVQVSLKVCNENVVFDEENLMYVNTFLNYTFANVLRLQKYLMLFDPKCSENSYFIVPTRTTEGKTDVDWDFLKVIYENKNSKPEPVPEAKRVNFQFDAGKYHDAVVMPWYRNQDQPQYFYVAEICSHLNPRSSFPGSEYKTFDEYYFKKYGIRIQNSQQPLLDVDHTSARLNFLTPRYVNRKGVALPTSSEETKRAKRENLEQKQILVPELCTVHPFPASLWRKAVCLPCILYRINALLLADQIRRQVATSISLGCVELASDFEWSPLDFGWSLADVLRKSKELNSKPIELPSKKTQEEQFEDSDEDSKEKAVGNTESNSNNGDWMEIGTWSNDMAETATSQTTIDYFNPDSDLPPNLTIINSENIRYASPTSWMGCVNYENDYDASDTDDSTDTGLEADNSEISEERGTSGIRIEFKGDVAEAVEDDRYEKPVGPGSDSSGYDDVIWEYPEVKTDSGEEDAEMEEQHRILTEKSRKRILLSNIVVHAEDPITVLRCKKEEQNPDLPHAENGLKLPELSVKVNAATDVLNGCQSYSDDKQVQLLTVEDDDSLKVKFSFDAQPDLDGHPGPSPSVILQALTMSNANDGINLERLETIGDSFLKYAITNYLYCTYDNIHEGKLSHLRSKQVSNLNLYRLGRRKMFGESMIATKFEPHDNWLPPCYYVPRDLEQALIEAGIPASHWNRADLPSLQNMSREEICRLVQERSEELAPKNNFGSNASLDELPCFIPYNLITQHSIPDKSVADCVEALIGAYLISCGPRGALLFMAWLGICVLPREDICDNGTKKVQYGVLKLPPSPLLHNIPNPYQELSRLLDGYEAFESHIGYCFKDRSYLLQSLTHASYSPNRLTDCYQRLEFLGDAILDYLITRHLYEDPRQHSPGALTDLRSALVNNTIFASLAVRHGFHKYFRHLSPGLSEVVDRFVRIQEENGHTISEEYVSGSVSSDNSSTSCPSTHLLSDPPPDADHGCPYYLIEEDECEEAEDVEVPKALGDVFESVAGAIFLDSGMSLDAVWDVYYRMMKTEIEQFSTNVPKSPIRELLELEPETAKFGKPEKLADGRRVRVTVEVFSKGTYKGIGRNYRIAKCTAAKCALKQLKKKGLLSRKTC